MIRLIQEFGAQTGRQLSFDQPTIKIGRAPANDIAFDPNVDLDSSGNHCEITRDDGVYYVVDSNSRNGTYLNGNRVQRQRLSNGDMIECGRGGPRLRVDLPQPQPVQMQGPGSGMPLVHPGGVAPTEALPVYPMHGVSQHPPAFQSAAPMPNPSYQNNTGPYAPNPGNTGPYAPMPNPAYPGNTGPYAPAPGPMAANPQPFSVGAAAVAGLPANAQVGKRTMAMMIDTALIQAGVKKSTAGIKIAMAFVLLAMVALFGGGGYYLWIGQQDTDERLAEVTVGGDTGAGERIARQFEDTIYMLASVQAGGGRPEGFCTGFAVTPDLIATNAHCVDAAQDQVTSRGRTIVALRNNGRGVQIPVQPLYRDPRFHNATMGTDGSGYDVGVVRASQPLPSQVRLVSLQDAPHISPGASIYVFGFPGMTMNEVSPVATITNGVVSRMTDFFDRAADDPSQAQKIQHSAQTTSGSSGSPIFLASGEVIGVNAGSLADEERQSMLDPTTGRRVSVEVNRSSNFKYGMRADLIRIAIQTVGETAQ